MDLAALTELLSATLRIATPLMFAALGGLLSERAGTFAVGIEGMMLAGAFGGALAALATGSTAMGCSSAFSPERRWRSLWRSPPHASGPTRWSRDLR